MQQNIMPVPTFKLSFQVQFFAETNFRVFKSLAKIAKIRSSRKFPLIRYVHCDLRLGDMTLGQGHDTTLGQGQQLCEILSSQLVSEKLWPRHRFSVHVHFDLGDMTLGQSHDTSLGHGQQLREILSRSNLVVINYSPDMDFWYVCTVTLTLEI